VATVAAAVMAVVDTGKLAGFPRSLPQILRTSPQRPVCFARRAFFG
jgi:hypothetical protein